MLETPDSTTETSETPEAQQPVPVDGNSAAVIPWVIGGMVVWAAVLLVLILR